MKRKFFQKPLLTLISIFIICFSNIFIINGCRKFDHSYERMHRDYTQMFFQVPGNTLPIVKRVAAYIEKENDKVGFINDFVRRNGLPRWDKARVVVQRSSNNNSRTNGDIEDSIILIPTIQVDSNIVHSFLACHVKKGDDEKINFRLFDGAAYKAYPNNNRLDTLSSSLVVLTCMSLDYVVNGRQWFKLKDSTILDTPIHIHPYKGIRYLQIAPQNPMALVTPITFTYCVEVWLPNSGQLVGASPNGPDPNFQGSYQTVCTDYTFWATVIDDDPIYTGPPPSGGGGGGGGGNWYDPANQPCRAMPGDNPCGSDSPLPYTPVVTDMDEFNPYQCDTIGVLNILRDSFPCVYHLLHDSIGNVNMLTQLEMFNNFGESKYFHLTFSAKAMGADTSATTTPGHLVIGPDNELHFHDTIFLNSSVLAHFSKEYVVSTILHEGVHAYINWCLRQYFLGEIDSIYLKAHFPLHWEWLMHQIMTSDQQHILMANNYIAYISQHTAAFGNPSVSDSLRQYVAYCLAWGGLKKTSAWGVLNTVDTCTIYATNGWASNYDAPSNSIYSVPGCSPSHSWYRDSLHLQNPCH